MWKVSAISGVLSVVFFLITRGMIGSMSLSEKIDVQLKDTYPKRITIMSCCWLLSFAVAIVTFITWIVKL